MRKSKNQIIFEQKCNQRRLEKLAIAKEILNQVNDYIKRLESRDQYQGSQDLKEAVNKLEWKENQLL